MRVNKAIRKLRNHFRAATPRGVTVVITADAATPRANGSGSVATCKRVSRVA